MESADYIPDQVEDEDVLLHCYLHDRNLVLLEVVLQVEADKTVLLLLEPLQVHGQDSFHGAALVRVNGLDSCVAVRKELVHLRGPLAIVLLLESRLEGRHG